MAGADPGRIEAAENCFRFGAERRLKSAAAFAATLRVPRGLSIRAARQFLSVTAVRASGNAGSVRFGVTVGRRNARRAVDRALIKRIVREACRHQASTLEREAASAGLGLAIALRLKSALIDGQGRPLAMTQWRRDLRTEADALLRQVLAQLRSRVLSADIPAEMGHRS